MLARLIGWLFGWVHYSIDLEPDTTGSLFDTLLMAYAAGNWSN